MTLRGISSSLLLQTIEDCSEGEEHEDKPSKGKGLLWNSSKPVYKQIVAQRPYTCQQKTSLCQSHFSLLIIHDCFLIPVSIVSVLGNASLRIIYQLWSVSHMPYT